MSFTDCEWKTPELNAGLMTWEHLKSTLNLMTNAEWCTLLMPRRFSPVMLQDLIPVTSF